MGRFFDGRRRSLQSGMAGGLYTKRARGLGISDLRRIGIALRVRWVWKDRCDGRRPRTNEKAVLAIFQAATVFNLGNGESTHFWTDRWLNGASIEELAPTVFTTVSARKRKALVADAMTNNEWVRHITGPLTMQVVIEVEKIYDLLETVELATAGHFHLGPDG